MMRTNLRKLTVCIFILGTIWICKSNVESLNCTTENTLCNNVTELFENVTVTKLCPPGFENSNGSAECTKCKVGYYKNSTMKKCVLCPSGKETRLEGMVSCNPCPKGKFKKKELFCQFCQNGFYNLGYGAEQCKECEEGYVCPCPFCFPVLCPGRGYCPAGSHKPLYCRWKALYARTGPQDDDCQMTLQLIGIIVGSIMVSLLVFVTILAHLFYKPNSHRIPMRLVTEDNCSRHLLEGSTAELSYTGL